jgi:hypothetical protein
MTSHRRPSTVSEPVVAPPSVDPTPVARPPDLIERLAHDLNNSLTCILGHCDLLECGALSAEEALWQIRVAAESAATLSRQLVSVEALIRNRTTSAVGARPPAAR